MSTNPPRDPPPSESRRESNGAPARIHAPSEAATADLASVGPPSPLTERIRACAARMAADASELAGLVAEADSTREWARLRFASLRDYLAATLEPVRGLDREQRADLARVLSDGGLTVREIAPIVGASKSTIATDLRADLPLSNSGQLASLDVCALAAEHAHDDDRGAAMLARFWAALIAGGDPVTPPPDRYRRREIPPDELAPAIRANVLESRMLSLCSLRAAHLAACTLGELEALAESLDVRAEVSAQRATFAARRWDSLARSLIVPSIADLRAADADRDPLRMAPIYAAEAWAA